MRHLLLSLLLIFVGCQPAQAPQPPIQLESGESCIIGKCTAVSPVWTMNGDGGITVKTDFGVVQVSIVGWPGTKEPTDIKLATVKYVQDLVGKEVVICGVLDKNHIVAKKLMEMPPGVK